MREFAENEIAPKARELDEKEEFSVELTRKMGELGLFGMFVSEEYGGSDVGYLSYCMAIEELARVDGSAAATVAAGNSLGIGPIFYFGDDEQKREWLPRLCRGEALASFGLTEPNAGSDAGGSQTTAEIKNGEWVINGSKIFITKSASEISEIIVVQAKTGERVKGKSELSGMLAEIQKHAGTLAQAQRRPEWPKLLARVAREVRGMPLFRLQTLRSGGKLVFVYEERITAGAIELLPGVVFCLRRFSGFIRMLARHGWLNEIRRNTRNAYLVGDTASLEEHLFPDERIPLGKIREVLEPIQEGKCFYCGDRLGSASHVDHFVPFALYPGNLAHNLVLAHGTCNSDKSDLLADIPHLDHWATRNQRYGDELSGGLAERGIAGDLQSAVGIARWAYGRADAAGALLWVRSRETRPYPRGALLPI